MSYNVIQSVLGAEVTSGNCTAGGGSAPSLWTSNLSSGSKLIAVVSLDASSITVPTSVKDAALNLFTQVASVAYPSAEGGLSAWILDTPAGDVGAKPVITSANGTNFGARMIVAEVSGLLAGSTSACLDGSAGTSTGAASPATGGAYGSTAAGEFLLAAAGDGGFTKTYTLTGYTTLQNSGASGNVEIAAGYKDSAGGAESLSWAISGAASWGSLLVAFQLAPSGSSSGPNYATAQSSSAWANPANAEALDGSFATWTAP